MDAAVHIILSLAVLAAFVLASCLLAGSGIISGAVGLRLWAVGAVATALTFVG